MFAASRGRGRTAVSFAACALLLGLAVLIGCSATPPSAAPAASDTPGSGIGAWPTFLPSPTDQGVEAGSLDSPAMSYPGRPVLVRIGSAEAQLDVDGPSYPSSTKVGAEQVRCTFTVRISGVTAPISMRTATFSVLDSQGGLHPMSAAPGHPAPERLVPGHEVSLTLVGVLPAGEGLLRFYPTTEGAVAAWDYVAETD